MPSSVKLEKIGANGFRGFRKCVLKSRARFRAGPSAYALELSAATVKVIVVGNGGVGKSSMTARYCKGVFTDSYKKTIGMLAWAFSSGEIQLSNIWHCRR